MLRNLACLALGLALGTSAAATGTGPYCYIGYRYDVVGNRIQRHYYCLPEPEPGPCYTCPGHEPDPGGGDDMRVAQPDSTTPALPPDDLMQAAAFPNPTRGPFTLVTPQGLLPAGVDLLDASGRVLLTKKLTSAETDFDISAQPSDTYYLRIYPPGQEPQHFKIVKL